MFRLYKVIKYVSDSVYMKMFTVIGELKLLQLPLHLHYTDYTAADIMYILHSHYIHNQYSHYSFTTLLYILQPAHAD